MKFSANGWSFIKMGDALSFTDVVKHLNGSGIQGFDLCIGEDAYPPIGFDASMDFVSDIVETFDAIGGYVASVVLISLPLYDVPEAIRQIRLGTLLARAVGAPRLNLLPRKNGITKAQAWDNLEKIWAMAGPVPKRYGIPVATENHTFSNDPDEDIFLFRNGEDFLELIERLNGELRIKYDPAWLLKAGDDPFELLPKLIDHVEILDLKDYTPDKFVAPGLGDLNFARIAEAFKARKAGVPDICVEVEHHHYFEQDVYDPQRIDSFNAEALAFYKKLFDVK